MKGAFIGGSKTTDSFGYFSGNYRDSAAFSPKAISITKSSGVPINSQDDLVGEDDWPELHQQIMRVQNKTSQRPRNTNLSVEILNNLISQSQ